MAFWPSATKLAGGTQIAWIVVVKVTLVFSFIMTISFCRVVLSNWPCFMILSTEKSLLSVLGSSKSSSPRRTMMSSGRRLFILLNKNVISRLLAALVCSWQGYPSMHRAVVNMCWFEIRDPLQMMVLSSPCKSAAIHGQAPLPATLPPTVLRTILELILAPHPIQQLTSN